MMFSKPINNTSAAITAATAGGLITVADNTIFFPGAKGWISKNDGSASMRVKLISRVGTTQLRVRRIADGTEAIVPAPSYGLTDVSAFNATSTLFVEAQLVPVVPDHGVRAIG